MTTDYTPEIYLTQIGLNPDVLRKLNGDYIFTVSGFNAARTAGRLDTLLSEDERKHVAERIAAVGQGK